MGITYIDEQGYQRYNETNRLVHRTIAWKYIYSANRTKYPLRFSEYQVHHIDGDKRNNKWNNLELVTEDEHEEKQGYKFNGYHCKKDGEPNYGYNMKPYQGKRIKPYQEIIKSHKKDKYIKNDVTFWTPSKVILFLLITILFLIIISSR